MIKVDRQVLTRIQIVVSAVAGYFAVGNWDSIWVQWAVLISLIGIIFVIDVAKERATTT